MWKCFEKEYEPFTIPLLFLKQLSSLSLNTCGIHLGYKNCLWACSVKSVTWKQLFTSFWQPRAFLIFKLAHLFTTLLQSVISIRLLYRVPLILRVCRVEWQIEGCRTKQWWTCINVKMLCVSIDTGENGKILDPRQKPEPVTLLIRIR